MVERPGTEDPEALDPFAPVGRGAYRVGVRLAPPDERSRWPWLRIGLVMLAVGVGIAAVGPRAGTAPAPPPRASELPPAPTDAVGSTALPAFQTFGWPHGAPPPFPTYAGGLRWVDPATGRIGGDPFGAPRGWIFPGTDGSAVCACLDSPWSETAAVEAVRTVRFDSAGRATSSRRTAVVESPFAVAGSIVRDVVIAPDRERIYVAYAAHESGRWVVGIDGAGVDPAAAALDSTIDLGQVSDPGGRGLALLPTLRIAPDGRHLRFTLRWRARAAAPGTAWTERAWVLATDPRLAAESSTDERTTTDPDTCDGEAWRTDVDYVVVCRRVAGDSVLPVVRTVARDGTERETPLGSPTAIDDVAWLVDASDGVVFRWSPASHVVSRLDPHGAVASRSLGDDPAALVGATPEASAVPLADRSVTWSTLAAADDQGTLRRLVGSADGTRLYAIGKRTVDPTVPGGPDTASTGVWVLDARTLEVVAHWAPAAMYDQIGLTPDGSTLVAIGVPGSDAQGRATSWGAPMAFHDTTDGRLLGLVGDSVGSDGYTPILLVPGGL